MNKTQDDLKFVEKEYIHISSELARYDSDSQKIFSFISIIITSTFLFGIKEKLYHIFLFIPLLSFASIQYLISIGYAYRVREKYMQSLESKFRKSSGQEIPAFYSKQIKKYYPDSKLIDRIFLPFSGLIYIFTFLLLSLGIYSCGESFIFLKSQYDQIYAFIYLIVFCLIFFYLVFSFFWGQKKLTNHKKKLKKRRLS